jgi:hypothetical protein
MPRDPIYELCGVYAIICTGDGSIYMARPGAALGHAGRNIAWINAGINMITVAIGCSALPTCNMAPRASVSSFWKACPATSIGDSCANASAIGIAGFGNTGGKIAC